MTKVAAWLKTYCKIILHSGEPGLSILAWTYSIYTSTCLPPFDVVYHNELFKQRTVSVWHLMVIKFPILTVLCLEKVIVIDYVKWYQTTRPQGSLKLSNGVEWSS